MDRNLEAFIFDLDGVITDTAIYHYEAWKELADSLGILIDYAFNEQLKGVSRLESLERILVLEGKQNDYTSEEKEQLANTKNQLYIKLIQQVTPANILPGILELLEELKAKKIKIGIASASKNAFDVITKLEIGHYFDYIIDAGTVTNGKPNPEIFMKVADYLGVSYENCVGIEDAEVGIRAIKSAGMFAVGVGSANILCEADYVVNETSQLSLHEINIKYLGRLKQAN